MRIVLCRFMKKVSAVGQVMLARRRRGRERRLNALGIRHLQGSVNLVGRYVIEALAFVFFWKRLPILLGGLKQRKRSHDICHRKSKRIFYASVDVTFGCKVNYAINFFVLHQFQK